MSYLTGKHSDWSLFSIWSELLSAMTDINSIWTSGCKWEEGEKNTLVTKQESHSRYVMSSCSQLCLCAPHLHLTSGPDVPHPTETWWCSAPGLCMSCFGITESCGKCCFLIQGKAKSVGLHMLQTRPLTWILSWFWTLVEGMNTLVWVLYSSVQLCLGWGNTCHLNLTSSL